MLAFEQRIDLHLLDAVAELDDVGSEFFGIGMVDDHAITLPLGRVDKDARREIDFAAGLSALHSNGSESVSVESAGVVEDQSVANFWCHDVVGICRYAQKSRPYGKGMVTFADIRLRKMFGNVLGSVSHACHSFVKLGNILSNGWGWLIGVGVAFIDYFAGHSFVVFLVAAATLIDAVWGIAVSIHNGQFTKSELARLTFAKLIVYGCVMFVFIGIDKMIDTNVTASVIGAAIVLVECWSSCASMLILYPRFLFLRLLKRALLGEIASKLKISEEEAKELMEGK